MKRIPPYLWNQTPSFNSHSSFSLYLLIITSSTASDMSQLYPEIYTIQTTVSNRAKRYGELVTRMQTTTRRTGNMGGDKRTAALDSILAAHSGRNISDHKQSASHNGSGNHPSICLTPYSLVRHTFCAICCVSIIPQRRKFKRFHTLKTFSSLNYCIHNNSNFDTI